MRLIKSLSVLICLLFVAMDGLRAQEAAAPAASQPPAANDPAANDPVANDAAAAVPSTPLREQSIYIPYNKLREVFEQQGRGVFLPYDKFQMSTAP